MSGRWTSLVAAALVLGLAVYAFWPAAQAKGPVKLCAEGLGPAFTLRHHGVEQRVAKERVQVAGWTLPAGKDRLSKLDQELKGLAVPEERLIADIDEGRAAAYGIDGSRALDATRRLRWGRADDRGYVLDVALKRLAVVPVAVLDRLDAACGRLDDGLLTSLPETPATVSVDGLELSVSGGAWIATFQRQRPAFTSRVATLLRLAGELPLDDLDTRTVPPVPLLAAIRIAAAPGPDRRVVELRLHAAPGAKDGWVAADDRPVQKLGPARLAEWRGALAAFARDHLVDAPAITPTVYASVTVRAAGVDRFTLVRKGFSDEEDGRSQWEVVWPLGREPAAADACRQLIAACNRLEVADPQTVADDAPPIEGATELVFERGPRVVIGATRARAGAHEGRITVIPPLLRTLSPEAMLERRLTTRPPQRIVKVQRRWPKAAPAAGPREEVVVKGDTGSWRRSFPSPGPTDALAVARLARAICQAEGRNARFAGQEGRAVVAAPDFELAVRFGPREDRKAANDDAIDLSDTAAEDAGWAFRQGDGGWLAVDLVGGVSWTVDDELMETLMAPLDHQVVVPVAPALVTVIERRGAGGRWLLGRKDKGWAIQDGTADAQSGELSWGPDRPADAVAVRRLLRLATATAASRTDPGAGRLQPGEITGSLSFWLPGLATGPSERVTVYIGKAVSGEVACSTESDRPDAPVPVGRWYLPQAEAEALLPPASAFAAPAAP